MKLKCNCCDGIYNSIDVHFTSACDNKCAHCIDMRFGGIKNANLPNTSAVVNSIIKLTNTNHFDDVLFLGGEPCLFLDDLLLTVKELKERIPELKLFVTTAVPKICYDRQETFFELITLLDGINLSVQSHREQDADKIRNTTSLYDRQAFYKSLPNKEKIRINLNAVKPYLSTKEDIIACLQHYDTFGFSSIKMSEIQHGEDVYVSVAKLLGIEMKSAYAHGCQSYLDMAKYIKGFSTPLLLKRSCFLCEDSLKASLADGVKVLSKLVSKPTNNYAVVYSDGTVSKGWI